MAQPADQRQENPPSVVGTLYNEHERTARFQDNLNKRPRDCDANGSFETKWAFAVAESKRADVERKTSNQLSSATMTITFALTEVKEEITELDSLLRGINVREHELDSMTNSLDKMCLTLAARSIDRKKHATAPRSTRSEREGVRTGGDCGIQQLQHEEADMQTAVKQETTITGPCSNVSTADEISTAEQPTPPSEATVLPGQELPSPCSHRPATSPTTATAREATSSTARSPTSFDYSALSAYTPPHHRTPRKMDSTVTCPRTAAKSRSSSRSRSERRS